MLLGLLSMAALGALGYNAVKDEESRIKTKSIVAKTIDVFEKEMTKKYDRGEMDEESQDRYRKFENAYNSDPLLNRNKMQQWKIDAEMLKFEQETGYSEDSIEYQDKLEYLQHKYFDYEGSEY